MKQSRKRPLIIVPPGMKDFFMKEAEYKDVSILPEIREVDISASGLDEFEELMGADFELEEEPVVEKKPSTPHKHLRLVYSNGKKLTP